MPRCLKCGNDESVASSAFPPAADTANAPPMDWWLIFQIRVILLLWNAKAQISTMPKRHMKIRNIILIPVPYAEQMI